MAFTNRKIVAGNWKMNGGVSKNSNDGIFNPSWRLINDLMDKFHNLDDKLNCEMIVCPNFLWLFDFIQMAEGYSIKFGAQNCSQFLSGAYTGEISPVMLKEAKVQFVLLGHSERRAYFYETNEIVAKKVEAALSQKITPIVCIGETLQEREAGKTEEVLREQFFNSLPDVATKDNVIIAYEPVWAIGTGKSASVIDIISAMNIIKNAAKEKFGSDDINVLYGGSVKSSNAKEIFSIDAVGGVLVGGASLDVEEFWKIANAV